MNAKYKINSKLNRIFIVLTLVTFTFGCEDVIKVDLNSANPTLVLEAEFSDNGLSSTLTITKTTDFYTVNEFETVSNASVILKSENGQTAEMTEISPGEYQTVSITPIPLTKYSIQVIVDGTVYEAESTMPKKIILDSLSIEKGIERPGGEDGKGRYILHVYFKDEPNVENYCRFKIAVNGIFNTGFVTYEDKYTDGNDIDARVQLDAEILNIKLNDVISVELQSIDKAAYDFYKTANSVNASGSSSGGRPSSSSVAPTNPISNWSNDALGFFSAYASSYKTIVISD